MAACYRPVGILSDVSGTIVMNFHEGGATKVAKLVPPCWLLLDVLR